MSPRRTLNRITFDPTHVPVVSRAEVALIQFCRKRRIWPDTLRRVADVIAANPFVAWDLSPTNKAK